MIQCEHVISELSCDIYVMRCWLVVIVRLLWRSFMSSSRLLCTEIGCCVGGVMNASRQQQQSDCLLIITSCSGFSPFRFETHLRIRIFITYLIQNITHTNRIRKIRSHGISTNQILLRCNISIYSIVLASVA